MKFRLFGIIGALSLLALLLLNDLAGGDWGRGGVQRYDCSNDNTEMLARFTTVIADEHLSDVDHDANMEYTTNHYFLSKI